MKRRLILFACGWAVLISTAEVIHAQDGYRKPWRLSYMYNPPNGTSRQEAEYFYSLSDARSAEELCGQANVGSKQLNPTAPWLYAEMKIESVTPSEWKSVTLENLRRIRNVLDRAEPWHWDADTPDQVVPDKELVESLMEQRMLLEEGLVYIKRLRTALLSTNGKIDPHFFELINRQIENFGRLAKRYNAFIAALESKPQPSRETEGKGLSQRNFPKIEVIGLISQDQLRGTLAKDFLSSEWQLAGKSGLGKFGDHELQVTFGEDGRVRFGAETEPIQGFYLVFENEISMITESFEYSGTIDANHHLSGTRKLRGSDAQDNWLIQLNGSSPQ